MFDLPARITWYHLIPDFVFETAFGAPSEWVCTFVFTLPPILGGIP